ncbi:MAG: NUDIX hydrolase [Candidatus Eremiobacteraeota bacterium]|nr:NUDIX hydrolase [Candidatus Eremiobacteraeota bacterium]
MHLASGILLRDGALLLVASRYRNHPRPLWNLPGGRQRDGELLPDTVRREFAEETSLSVHVGSVRFVSESYDRATRTHFLSVIFDVRSDRAPHVPPGDAHAVECAWVPLAELGAKLDVDVVREPLLAHLADERKRYFGFENAGITIDFSDAP